MAEYTTLLEKMPVEFGNPVLYYLPATDRQVHIENLLGQTVRITFTGRMFCINCGRSISKTFGEGLCFPCFNDSAANSPCIIHPELCEAHLGKGRDPEWEERNHNRPHIVYLALTKTAKVGVTRDTNIPNRWIDQGALKAIPMAHTPHRRAAGDIEVYLKNYISDKTPWQAMLRGEDDTAFNLTDKRAEMLNRVPNEIEFTPATEAETAIVYPILQYPLKISSMNLMKTGEVSGVLTGIRGQYLMFDRQNVINIRSHSGYEVKWHLPD